MNFANLTALCHYWEELYDVFHYHKIIPFLAELTTPARARWLQVSLQSKNQQPELWPGFRLSWVMNRTDLSVCFWDPWPQWAGGAGTLCERPHVVLSSHTYSPPLAFDSCFFFCRPSELGPIHPGWVWPPQSHGGAACGAALQSAWASRARLPLVKGQHAPGTFWEVPEDSDGAAHREQPPLGLRQLRVWSIQPIRHCQGDRPPVRET